MGYLREVSIGVNLQYIMWGDFMSRFYHIDRLNSLRVGQEINLMKFKDISCNNPSINAALQSQFDMFMKEGVSRHGDHYFATNPFFYDTSYDIELIFEYERKLNFPELPSRFQSLFAVDRENIFPMLYRLGALHKSVRIYEVECNNYFKADMNLLYKGSNLINTFYAKRYWSGENLSAPLYEYLLKLPVKVIRRVAREELL